MPGDLYAPEFIQVEINTGCNLTCPMCPTATFARGRPPARISAGTYREVFGRSFRPGYTVLFNGFSETLLNRDLAEMVRFEVDRGNRVFVGTNGVLLEEPLLSELLDAGVAKLCVSLDTPDPGLFAQLRPGAAWEAVLDRVAQTRDAIERKAAGTRIGINYVVMRSTAHAVHDFLRLMHRYRLDELALIKLMKMPGQDDDAFFQREWLDWPAYYQGLDLPRLRDAASQWGIELMWSDQGGPDLPGCAVPASGLYVAGNLDVASCAFTCLQPEYVFGNLGRETISDILAHPAFRAFRSHFEQGGSHPVCRSCATRFMRVARPGDRPTPVFCPERA
jgi:MoaA/NifB/PqqE/SkfB family radical SAM enzyme